MLAYKERETKLNSALAQQHALFNFKRNEAFSFICFCFNANLRELCFKLSIAQRKTNILKSYSDLKKKMKHHSRWAIEQIKF